MPPTMAGGKVCYLEMPATDIVRAAGFYKSASPCRGERTGPYRFSNTRSPTFGPRRPNRPATACEA